MNASKKIASTKLYKKKRTVTIVGTILNLFLTAIKYVIGYMSGSAALISDATHSASDYIGDLIVLIGIKIASMPADENHPYGHGKFETAASLAVGLLIVGAGLFLLYEGIIDLLAVTRGDELIIKEYYVYALYTAAISIIIKEGLYHYTIYYGRQLDSPALLANAAHHRSDSYSSIGVLVGIIFTLYFPSLRFMDPLAAIAVAILILYTAWEILNPAFHELVETVPDMKLLNEIKELGNSTIGVKDSKDIRIRSVGGKLLVDIKIEVESTFTLYQAYSIAETVKKNIKKDIKRVIDVIVHLEPSIETSLVTLQKQSKIETIIQKIIDMYGTTLKGAKDIRYYYVNQGIDIILIFLTHKELSTQEADTLSDTIRGILHESYKDIKNLYIGFQYRHKQYAFHK